MKSLIILLLLTTTALAQNQKLPQVVTLTNNATGEKIGTMTILDNHAFIRGLNGEFIAQMVVGPDGSRKVLDEQGNEIKTLQFPKAGNEPK